jgi:tripartite-type tricarboxylate transporter receptor subunit TctC
VIGGNAAHEKYFRETTMHASIRYVAAMLMAANALHGTAHAQGDAAPRPLRLIVPFAPGGGTDITARLIGLKLGENLGIAVVIDNRGGGNGAVGMEAAARAAPDGNTLVMITSSQAINMSAYAKVTYDLLRDYAPVTRAASQPYSLVVHPSVAAKSVKELIALAAAKPGGLNYAVSGEGSLSHLAGELFAGIAGIRLTSVPYKGGAPALNDTIGGHVQLYFSTLLQATPHIKSGKLRALAVTTAGRNATYPDLPTMIEAGVPGYEVAQWFGILAPAKTPKAMIAKRNADIVRVLNQPDVKGRLAADGGDVIADTPESFGQFVRADVARWSKVVKQIGLRLE